MAFIEIHGNDASFYIKMLTLSHLASLTQLLDMKLLGLTVAEASQCRLGTPPLGHCIWLTGGLISASVLLLSPCSTAYLNEAGFNFVRKCIDLVETRGEATCFVTFNFVFCFFLKDVESENIF